VTFSIYPNFVRSVAAQLVSLRTQKCLTQQVLADAIGLHITQIERYEADTAQPSLEAIKKLAQTLRVTTDFLIFRKRNWKQTPISPCSFRTSPICKRAAIRYQEIVRKHDHQVGSGTLVF